MICTLVLTFVFAFDDGQPQFELGYWISNFIRVFFIVLIGVVIHDFAHDLIAKRNGLQSEYRVWGVRRFGFGEPIFPKTIKLFGKERAINQFPLGILIALIVTLFSNGKLYWAAVSSYGLVIEKTTRLGKKFVDVTDFEEAKIAVAGPLAVTFLMLIFKMFNGSGTFDQLVTIYSWMAIFDMLPFPGMDGSKVFFGSVPMYIFSASFIVSAVILAYVLGAVPALIFSALAALAFLAVYAYYFIYK